MVDVEEPKELILPLMLIADEETERQRSGPAKLLVIVLGMASSVFILGSVLQVSCLRKGSPEVPILQFFCRCIFSLPPPTLSGPP